MASLEVKRALQTEFAAQVNARWSARRALCTKIELFTFHRAHARPSIVLARLTFCDSKLANPRSSLALLMHRLFQKPAEGICFKCSGISCNTDEIMNLTNPGIDNAAHIQQSKKARRYALVLIYIST